METPWAWMPCLAHRGQGCRIFLLTVTAHLWLLTTCQLDSFSDGGRPWSPIATPVETSFTPITTSSELFSSTESLFIQHITGTLSLSNTLPVNELLETSLFIEPSVSHLSTPAGLTSAEEELQSSFLTDLSDVRTAELSSIGSEGRSTAFVFQSAIFTDTVVASLHSNLTDENSPLWSASHVQPSTQPMLGTFASDTDVPVLDWHISSSLVLVALTPSADIPTRNSTKFTSRSGLEAVAATSVIPSSEFFLSTAMLDANSTVQATAMLNSSSTGEATSSLFSSVSGISTPGSSQGNGSCTDKESGCVEYRGEGGEEVEKVRIKIIVGVACGALLMVVIVGVFIGCVWRRRGKMSSGSKIDLSSYWDDSVTLSYINGHIDIPKDSADEMISLDNDSFLNSLDSMSFTNTWTSDTSKHTNF